MALVYALVDAYNKWDGEPFIYAGKNSNCSSVPNKPKPTAIWFSIFCVGMLLLG